jgi:hypothetical protein
MGSALRRTAIVVLLAPVLILVSSPSAGAALCVRLSTSPVRPAAGQLALLDLRTLAPISEKDSGFRLEPTTVRANFPFHVTASRTDQLVLIHLERSSDPTVWTGQFVLSQSGLWHLLIENFEPSGATDQVDPRCYSPLPIVVSAAGGQPQPSGPSPSSLSLTLLLAVAVLAVLVGTTLFVVVRSRVPPRGPP